MKLEAIRRMLGMIPSVLRGVKPKDLESLKALTRSTFPNVGGISTEQLALALESGSPPMLIDVRSPHEFELGHLPGAVNQTDLAGIEAQMQRQPIREFVFYCAVGFRSARVVNHLVSRGHARCRNLEGSIFQWANEGRALEANHGRKPEVHPVNERWRGMLRPR